MHDRKALPGGEVLRFVLELPEDDVDAHVEVTVVFYFVVASEDERLNRPQFRWLPKWFRDPRVHHIQFLSSIKQKLLVMKRNYP